MGGPGSPVQGAGRGCGQACGRTLGSALEAEQRTAGGVAARGSGRSPCSSLLAAARRVDDVLPPSVLGVPGRLSPRELPPDGLRSLLGGVFFFCGDGVGAVSLGTGRPPAHSGPGLGLTAMKRADDASLSMSLSSELSDSSLLSAGARGGTLVSRSPPAPAPPRTGGSGSWGAGCPGEAGRGLTFPALLLLRRGRLLLLLLLLVLLRRLLLLTLLAALALLVHALGALLLLRDLGLALQLILGAAARQRAGTG